MTLDELKTKLLEAGISEELVKAFQTAVENNVLIELQAAGVFQSK